MWVDNFKRQLKAPQDGLKHITHHHLLPIETQGCQHPDLSLRTQTFRYTADFFTTFYICLKPKFFCTFHHKILETKTFFAHLITKPPASILEFKNFNFILQKKYLWPQTKTGKAPPPSWRLLCLGSPMACGNAYVKHFAQFPDFF